MANILLLGAGGNAGINFTKCVQRLGHKVFGADMNKYYLDSCNADVKVNIDYSPTYMVKVYSVLNAIGEYKIDMVHAQPDPEVEWLLKNSALFPDVVFKHKLDTWQKFSNKMLCQDIWSERYPFATYSFLECALNPKHFLEMKEKGGGKVWVRAIKGAGSRGALPVTSFQQAENWVSYWEEAKGFNMSDFMLCQYLPGKEYAVQTFWLDGQLVQSQARERIIYFFGALMPSGQTSTPAVARTVDNFSVNERAWDAIKMIDPKPHGIYCVDLKEDIKGEVIPMEVNYGRFFTTSDFFAAMGLNTPSEYVHSFTNPEYRPSVMINYLKPDWYWVRGLDKEPKLIKYDAST